MNTKNKKSNGPGRPQYVPVIPKGKFTFTDFEVANGVNPKTGKGKNCTTLTLRKWLKKDLAKRNHSLVSLLKDTLAEPTGKKGLGRKQYVYQKRVATPKESTPKESGETKKEEVLAPVVNISPNPTPETAAPISADPAPVAETPVAETVTVPVEQPVEA